jgi:hypothetical protein
MTTNSLPEFMTGASFRCAERGCPYSVAREGEKCRIHLRDDERSYVGSSARLAWEGAHALAYADGRRGARRKAE